MPLLSLTATALTTQLICIGVPPLEAQSVAPAFIAQVIEEGGRPQDQVAIAGDQLFFIGYDKSHGHELWVSDGTPSGTRMVKDIYVGDDPKNIRYLHPFGSRVLFLADDGTSRYGRELWISDGTDAGTRMVKDNFEGPRGFRGSGFEFGQLNDHVILFGDWHDLYRTDGTDGGTYQIGRIPGSDNQRVYEAIPLGHYVIFTNRYEIWGSDGTEEGTHELAQPGQTHGSVAIDSIVFVGSKELWISDGTEAGTRIVKDIFEGPNDSHPSHLRRAGSRVVFVANNGRLGYELWVTDGTEAGTRLLKDVTPGVEGSDIEKAFKVEGSDLGMAFYLISHKKHGSTHTLWRTDGTETGTIAIDTNFQRGAFTVGPERVPCCFVLHNGLYYYLVFVSPSPQLWATNGTPEGTKHIPVALPRRSGFIDAITWYTSFKGHLYGLVGRSLVKLL